MTMAVETKEKKVEVEAIISAIEQMTVLELASLVKTLEEKFGVSAAIPAAAGPATSGGEAKPAAEEKTTFTLVLTGAGPYSPAAAALSLGNGADEYFAFPPDPRLFRARLLNLLARGAAGAPAAQKPAEYVFGALRISPEARTAQVGAARLKLTALEFDLLLYFLRNQGRVVSRTVLLEQVWRQGLEAGPRAVDKRIEALRSSLGPFGARIRTVFGLGYLFKM